MIQKGNFLLLHVDQFKEWLSKQKITRSIKTLQVHHTWLPNYETRKVFNGIGKQDKFVCSEGMRNSHLKNGMSHTAQNITIFEDEYIGISLDRNLNVTPAGIKGANTNSICIEIIGNFDIGGDSITEIHKNTIIKTYAALCEVLKIKPSTKTIVYHCWYTASGTYLGDYIKGKSAKTCPGTNFLGLGNTKESAIKYFIPLIEKEMNKKDGDTLELTDYQWGTVKENIKFLLQEKVITSTSWLEKSDKRTLTNSEISWLNMEVSIRLYKKLPK